MGHEHLANGKDDVTTSDRQGGLAKQEFQVAVQSEAGFAACRSRSWHPFRYFVESAANKPITSRLHGGQGHVTNITLLLCNCMPSTSDYIKIGLADRLPFHFCILLVLVHL